MAEEAPPTTAVAPFSETDLAERRPELPSKKWARRQKRVVLPLVAVSTRAARAARAPLHDDRRARDRRGTDAR